MPDRSASRMNLPEAAGPVRRDRRLVTAAVGGILLALLAVVVMLRLQRLSEVPPGLHADEGAHGVDALLVLQGEHAIFFPPRSPSGSDGREGFVVYAIALSVSYLGRTMLALRLPTAIGASMTVFVVFWLGRMLFGRDEDGNPTPWRGLLIGGVGAGLLAVSIGQTIIGRMAFRANYLPLFLSLCLAFLWWGWKERSLWKIALAGLFAGLLHYTYVAARVTPLLFICLGLSSLLILVGKECSDEKHQSTISRLISRLRTELTSVGTFAAVAILVAAPIVIYIVLNPQDFSTRISQLWIFREGPQNFSTVLLVNLWDHLLALGFRGDPAWRRNFAAQPMLNPWEAFFFWSGLGISLWRWKKSSACRLLALWLGVMVLPAVLARDVVPHTIRMIGASPAIFLLAGFGIWETLQLLRSRLPGLKWKQKQLFQTSGVRFSTAIGILLAVMVLVQGVITHQTYFHKWAESPHLSSEYEVEWSDLTDFLNAQSSFTDTVYLIPDGQRLLFIHDAYRSYTFDFLYQGETPAFLFHSALPNLAQEIESTLSSNGSPSIVKVVEWKISDIWTGDENDRLALLLGKYGRYKESENHESFILHTYTEVSLEPPWTFYDHFNPLTVSYDRGIELQGFSLEYDVESLPQQELFDLGENRNVWVSLKWQTAPELATDFAASLRLHDSEGAGVYQQDAVLWKPDHSYTGDEGPSEQFDTLFHLELPADLPSGEYELRLVVYDFETQQPTVELGVWEPETTIARLHFSESN